MACFDSRSEAYFKLTRTDSSMLDIDRPAASTAARRASRLFSISCGVFDVACHPSPRVATRRKAPGLSPPTQIGGCGFCTGFGAKPMSSSS